MQSSGLNAVAPTGGQPKYRHSSTLSPRSPARFNRLYSNHSVTFSSLRLTQTNDLRPPEIGATFLFCNILTVETSLWALRSTR
jgi:hypothetical protein